MVLKKKTKKNGKKVFVVVLLALGAATWCVWSVLWVSVNAKNHLHFDLDTTGERTTHGKDGNQQQQQQLPLEQPPPQTENNKDANKDANNDANNNLPSLRTLFQESHTDKHHRHHYDNYYDRWFQPFRHVDGLTFLEIGVDQGFSLEAWSRYFTAPNRNVIGLAYSESTVQVEDKVQDKGGSAHTTIVRGDQSQPETIKQLVALGPFHIIVDDGSHVPAHMAYTLFSLWEKAVRPGGLYVIEDLETNYWQAGSVIENVTLQHTGIGHAPPGNFVEKLKQFVDVLNRHQLHARDDLSLLPGDDTLCDLIFGGNLVALRKCSNYEMANRPDNLDAPVDGEEILQWVRENKKNNPPGFQRHRRRRRLRLRH